MSLASAKSRLTSSGISSAGSGAVPLVGYNIRPSTQKACPEHLTQILAARCKSTGVGTEPLAHTVLNSLWCAYAPQCGQLNASNSREGATYCCFIVQPSLHLQRRSCGVAVAVGLCPLGHRLRPPQSQHTKKPHRCLDHQRGLCYHVLAPGGHAPTPRPGPLKRLQGFRLCLTL